VSDIKNQIQLIKKRKSEFDDKRTNELDIEINKDLLSSYMRKCKGVFKLASRGRTPSPIGLDKSENVFRSSQPLKHSNSNIPTSINKKYDSILSEIRTAEDKKTIESIGGGRSGKSFLNNSNTHSRDHSEDK
jgi:hypothetical protein